MRVGIASSPVTSGSTSITGIVDYVNAPATGTDRDVTDAKSYESGQFVFYGFAQVASDGRYYPAGSDSVNIRPYNWAWDSTVVTGGSVPTVYSGSGLLYRAKYLTATEWNDFTERINDFREYKGLSSYSFTTVFSDEPMVYTQGNEARSAISAMSPPTPVPSAIISNSGMTSAFVNGLKNSLNSIT
jgi:hypothetical protein